jgi:hypothetical protein
MKNFSSPENIHQHTPRPKKDEKRCMGVLDVSSTLSKNFQSRPTHALVSRIEKLFSKFNSHTVLGDLGEELLKAKLQEQGWHNVAFADEKQRGDVAGVHPQTGEIVRFEVKAAKRDSQQRWQFCMNKAKKTSCSYSDFVFLLVIDEHGKIYCYLVPSAFFGRIKQIAISSHPTAYKGKLAPFRLRSESIDIYQSREIYQLGAKQ